jgi:hypothetical protein
VGWDRLSGWLIFDPHDHALCIAAGDPPCSNHDVQALSAAQSSTKEAKQMGPSFIRGRQLAGDANRDAEGLHQRGQAVLQLLAAHTDFPGQGPAGLNRLEKDLCQRVSGRNAGIGYFRGKDHSTLRIDSDCNRGAPKHCSGGNGGEPKELGT